MLQGDEPTPENYASAVREAYGDQAEDILELHPASTEDEVMQAATDLAGDRFIGFSTWKRPEAPVYRYFYTHPRPPMRPEITGREQDGPPPLGAVHSAEVEYALGNLANNPVYAWTEDDYAVSEVMKAYFANFIKTGDPNGSGLPTWPDAGNSEDDAVMVMRIDVNSEAEPEQHRNRYLLLDQSSSQ